jgi:hypothetical protein
MFLGTAESIVFGVSVRLMLRALADGEVASDYSRHRSMSG